MKRKRTLPQVTDGRVEKVHISYGFLNDHGSHRRMEAFLTRAEMKRADNH